MNYFIKLKKLLIKEGFGKRGYYSKTKAREYAKTMEDIKNFCDENDISYSKSMDSFYFTLDGLKYRVSNHTIKTSDKGMYDWQGTKVRDSYHNNDYNVEITAGKTRIKEIYNNLKAGKILDKRGNVK